MNKHQRSEMSFRIINYYEFPEHEPDWARLRQLFKHNVSKYNVPWFEADSHSERAFLRVCEESGVSAFRKTIFEFDGKGAETGRFLFLCLKDDSGACSPDDAASFVDYSAACPGGGPFGSCGRGARQVDKVLVKPKLARQVTASGLLSLRHPSVPRIYLVAAEVAEALKSLDATGCEITSTDTPNCYQLRVTAETPGPARIGHARMGKRCPICGTAKMFIGNSERYFHRSDLGVTDFQNCRVYFADNVGQFEILNGFPIISQRIFSLLIRLKVNGIARYSTDPPIRHAVVQVRG